ncbi:hypothetical protein BJ170DRAFT_628561 [Xylariales sp. AK1849]|nr:hypothetical protein BJ170DRAFT_628561 [Xylariales sp. AK1849]
MALMKQARKCLHAYGIHSATIQSGFCLDKACSHNGEPMLIDGTSVTQRINVKNGQCLVGCTDSLYVSHILEYYRVSKPCWQLVDLEKDHPRRSSNQV